LRRHFEINRPQGTIRQIFVVKAAQCKNLPPLILLRDAHAGLNDSWSRSARTWKAGLRTPILTGNAFWLQRPERALFHIQKCISVAYS
jgi:hypothetical protein